MGCGTNIVPDLDKSIKAVKGQDPALEMKIERAFNEYERKQKKLPKKPPSPSAS